MSEHLAFVRAGGVESGHLLPVQRTQDAMEVLIENISHAQPALPVPLALENIASLVEWPDAEMDEGTFLRTVLDRTGCRLLLDVSNLYANAGNHGFDPASLLSALPASSVAYLHVGGGVEHEGLYHDTHCHPVPEDVLDLLRTVTRRLGQLPVLLERDDAFPLGDELHLELDRIRTAVSRQVGSLQ